MVEEDFAAFLKPLWKNSPPWSHIHQTYSRRPS